MLPRPIELLLALILAAGTSCTSDPVGPAGATGGAGMAPIDASVDSPSEGGAGGGATSDAGAEDGEAPDSGTGGAEAGTPEEPCPSLPIPSTCFGREVVYRQWGPTATGDGTYFVDQAPGRLGFTRSQGRIWVVQFQLEENTYFGRVSAYGDGSGSFAWIAREPCDATFAIDNALASFSMSGGGGLDFVVVRDDADETELDTNAAYASWAAMPRLRGGHCYYLAFENAAPWPDYPLDAADIENAVDDCGVNGDGTCYYLAMDFNHRLHDIQTQQLVAGNVIAGLTH